MSRLSKIVFTSMLLASACGARELIYFNSGFTLEVQSHEQQGETTLVQVGAGNLAFPSSAITRIEAIVSSPEPEAAKLPILEAISPAKLVAEAAIAQGVDEAFVRSVAQVESGLVPGRMSRKGAIGLMQLMPKTAKELGVDPTRNEENARGGAHYLRELLLRYKGDSALALAAYNAGPGAVQRYQGVPPYLETRHYVLAVLNEYNRQLRLQQALKLHERSFKMASKPTATD